MTLTGEDYHRAHSARKIKYSLQLVITKHFKSERPSIIKSSTVVDD